jgi:hypothetical protein
MTYQEDNLKGSLIASTILHVGGLLVMSFGLPLFSKPPPLLPWTPVPVDIVEIGAITNTRIRGADESEQTARTSPPEKAAPAPEEKAPVPPVKPSVEKKVLPPDDVAPPMPGAKPKPPAPKPVEKPQPAADPLASVLKNVAKMKPPAGPVVPDARPDEKSNPGESKTGTAKGFGPALGDRLTISQEDALRRQIGGCWNMPVGARNAEDLIVEVLIEVNEDRTVRTAEIVDQNRLGSDSHFRAAAEAALRALRHPKCTPLDLPADQYEQWKIIRFNFDPRDML